MEVTPKLSCQQCKTRKRRCDKNIPCSPCKHAGLDCAPVQRARMPRGRTAKAKGRNTLLESRVARIESLLQRQAEAQQHSPSSLSDETYASASPQKIGEFVAPDFWNALSEEVHGLRETLETPGDEEDGQEESPASEPASGLLHTSYDTASILLRHSTTEAERRLPVPSSRSKRTLLELYRYRVDSVYKLLHWPTALTTIDGSNEGFNKYSLSTSSKALEYAIYLLALCSITDNEAQQMRLGDRQDLLVGYRTAVEDLIAQSNLLQSPDLIVLQAFVIYLIGLRTCLSGGHTWTLVAVAVRVASALRLGHELPGEFSDFDLQLRRRVFFAIAILDTHSALDRGTVPILPSSALHTPPLSINDDEMSSEHVPTVSSPGGTEMAHTSMVYDAMICQRKLYEVSSKDEEAWNRWQEKLDVIGVFGNAVQNHHSKIGESPTPLERLQVISANKIRVSMQLLLRRPPYRHRSNAVPPWDDFNIMEAATEVLEHHLQPIPADLEPWAWKNWVQWHALAVLLTELMMKPQDPFSDRAYSVATMSFRHYARLVADSESGLLWRPIARLMRRVQRSRKSCGIQWPSDGPWVTLDVQNLSLSLDGSTPKPSETLKLIEYNFDDIMPDMAWDDKYWDGPTDSIPQFAWSDFLHDMDN